MTPPRVTVAIPTWNRAHLLRPAVQSVLDQTLPDFELHVFDNASDDDTEDVVRSFADERIHYHRNAENIGHLRNLTRCLQAGEAPYVTVLHDKEAMLPRNLEVKVGLLDAHPSVAFVHGGFRMVDAENRERTPHRRGAPPPEDYVMSGRQFVRRTFHGYGAVQHISSVVARRSAVAGDGFRAEDAPADDVALWLRLATRGDVAYSAEPLTLLRATPGWSSTNQYLELKNGRFYMTMQAAAAGKRVRRAFIDAHPMPLTERLVLGSMTRGFARRLLISYIRRTTPQLRPPKEAIHLLGQALKIEPTLLFSPRVALLARSYDKVDPARLDEPDAPTPATATNYGT